MGQRKQFASTEFRRRLQLGKWLKSPDRAVRSMACGFFRELRGTGEVLARIERLSSAASW